MCGGTVRKAKYAGICLAGLLALSALAAPTGESLRAATLEYVRNGSEAEGIARFSDYLGRKMGSGSLVAARDLAGFAAVADCIRFLEISKEAVPTGDVAAWVLGSSERLHLLVDTIAAQDRSDRCLEIMDRLHAHDPEGSEAFYELVLAIALVADRPPKHPMHGQMGKGRLGNESGSVERYDYFKALYAGGKAKMDYGRLGVLELLFVVYVPVPIAELEWVLENEDGALSDWAGKYSGIAYDRERLRCSQYQWPGGDYTLAAIREKGGICVDQAYYAVMSARAYGIPAIYFHGSGKSSNHAWFGYMKAPGKWVLDVGRYKGGEYTTGYAINPQTGERIIDHDMEFICEGARRSPEFSKASAYVSVAEVLEASHPDVALRCAVAARKRMKRYLRPWKAELRILLKRRDGDELIRFFKEQKKAFGEYPDILAASAERIEPALREMGRDGDADRLVRDLAGAVDDDRDDLAQTFGLGEIERMMESGDPKRARKKMEQLLNDHKEGGNKVFGLVELYAKFAMESGQEHEAARFLSDYIGKLRYENRFPASYERRLLMCLYLVHEKDGNKRKAAEVRRQLESLGFKVGE
jgi:hypothetical protein